jgi:hypothetical protein
MDRSIKFLSPEYGEKPCAKAQWRQLLGDLYVCDVCDEPAKSCYVYAKDYPDTKLEGAV